MPRQLREPENLIPEQIRAIMLLDAAIDLSAFAKLELIEGLDSGLWAPTDSVMLDDDQKRIVGGNYKQELIEAIKRNANGRRD